MRSALDLGAREVVVDEDRRGGVDVDVEPHALENRIALLRQVQLAARGHRRQQAGVEVDVARQPGFVDRDLSADEDLVAVLGDPDVGVGDAAQVERRVVGDVLRDDLRC